MDYEPRSNDNCSYTALEIQRTALEIGVSPSDYPALHITAPTYHLPTKHNHKQNRKWETSNVQITKPKSCCRYKTKAYIV